MALPYKLTDAFSRLILCDVLQKMLKNITSVTANVDVPTVVQAALAGRPVFQFSLDNDFGIILDRLASEAAADATPASELSALYDSVATRDAYADDYLNDVAYHLASVVVAAYVLLRDTIPSEVEDLTGRIDAMLKDRLASDPITLPEVSVQHWGQLSDDSYRSQVFNACRQYANVYEENRPIRNYYVAAALAAAERLEGTNLEGPLAEEANALFQASKPEALSESDEKFFSRALFRDYGIRNLVSMARAALENGAALDQASIKLTQFETIIHTMSTKTIEDGMSSALIDWLSEQLVRLELVCQLINGAFYAQLLTVWKDMLIVANKESCIVVNGFTLPAFEEAGGTLETIQAFGFYLSHEAMVTAYGGWSKERVLDMAEKVVAALATIRTETERRLQLDNTVMLRSVVERVVTAWCTDRGTEASFRTPYPVMTRALNTLLTNVAKPEKAIGDLLTNYLIEIRNNRFLRDLKEAVVEEFSALMTSDAAAVNKDQRNTAIAQAMVCVVADQILENYTELRDAA